MKTLFFAALAVLILFPAAAAAQTFSTVLTGANEFPAPGDPDGGGLAVITINGTTINYTILAQNIANVTGAHIHTGAAGTEGGVLINLNPTFNGGGASGSAQATAAQVNAIVANPVGYYVNVHTSEFPNGAIRGQLVGGGTGNEQPSTCTPGDNVMCLTGNRFKVEASFTTPQGQTGIGHAVEVKDDSGYFWFFDQNNIEVTVKVLNACSIAPTQWVFAAGMTNVQVVLKVTDTQTGAFRTYSNPQGVAFLPIQDTSAFDCP